MLDDWMYTMVEIAALFAAAAVLFLVVIPAILWTYDKINLVRRRRRMYRAMMVAVHNHLLSINQVREIYDGPR
jgi:hypothetical protein